MRDHRLMLRSALADHAAFIPTAIVGSAVVGAGASMIGSSNAASAQEQAANQASQTQMAMYNQNRADLAPFRAEGQNASNALMYGLGIGPNTPGLSTGGTSYGSLAQPVIMNEATLQQTPGYQFNLNQGLKAVQNSAAARGLGMSGAALKGASSYATGLADSTYQNQFSNAVTNATNTYNRLMGASQLGENAAAQTGAYGTQVGSNIGQNIIGAGNAQAAGSIAGANAISGAASNLGNYYMTNQLLNGGGLYGGSLGADYANAAAAGIPDLAGLY